MFSMEISCFPSHLPKQLPKHKVEGVAAGRVTALCSRKMLSRSSLSCSYIRKCNLQKNLSCCNFVEYSHKTSSYFDFEKIRLLKYKCKNTRLFAIVREPIEDESKEEGETPVCEHSKSLNGNEKTTIATKGVEQVLHMVGGDGEISYCKNSRVQSKGIMKAMPIIEEAVKEVYKTLAPKKFVAVDLGCASGPNTFLVVSEIASIIDKLSQQLGLSPPEIQMFLNDLPGNDFNNIFMSLADYAKLIREKEEIVVPLYVVGSPGSFYTRLFPSESVHFFHSSYSQMWLSKVPTGVEDQNVSKLLYMEQFKEDFSTFLKLRSKELISGGRMVLTILGNRESPKHKDSPYVWGLVSVALNDMISEGLLEEKERNAINFPIHSPSMEEIKSIIQTEGSFNLDQLKAFELSWDPFDESINNYFVSDYAIRGKFVANYIRALVEPLLDHHFDKETINDLFSRYAEILAVHLKEKPKLVNFILDLKLKG